MAFPDGRSERTLEGNVVALDAVNSGVGNDRFAIFELGSDIAGLPLDGRVGGGEDVLDGLCDFGTNAVTFYERDGVFALQGR